MPSTPSTEQLRLISDAARALEKADPCNGDRGRIVARLAETLNRSLNTTYQYLKKYGGWESGKKPRKGKGGDIFTLVGEFTRSGDFMTGYAGIVRNWMIRTGRQ